MAIRWPQVLDEARAVMANRGLITLRQVFYRLVSAEVLPNSVSAYKRLSEVTAAARRAGTFPAFADRGRRIERPLTFDSPVEAGLWLVEMYRRDRTEGQEFAVYLGVEKDGMVEQLATWFDAQGLPVVALRGYASQTIADDVRTEIEADGRPAVLLYAGDFDPSGEDILRDFTARTRCWHRVERVALTAEQVLEYALPPLPGKPADSRAAGFTARHGRLVQVEVDALDPDDLRRLFAAALTDWHDPDALAEVLHLERADRDRLDRALPDS